jgi:hypothetical protein
MKNPVYRADQVNRKNLFMQEIAEATSVTTLNKIYTLNETGNPVSFYTVIGDIGQRASTDVMLVDSSEKKKDLYVDHTGNVPVTVIGTNESLKGSRLFISFAINAVSNISNYCEGLVVVSGGDTPATHLLYETVPAHGELSLLTCIIRFR